MSKSNVGWTNFCRQCDGIYFYNDQIKRRQVSESDPSPHACTAVPALRADDGEHQGEPDGDLSEVRVQG